MQYENVKTSGATYEHSQNCAVLATLRARQVIPFAAIRTA
jgi:hypothetical protein